MTSEAGIKYQPTSDLMDEDSLLTPHELAALLRVPVSWVYAQPRGRSKAGLPFVKMGRYVRFDRAAVRKFIASKTGGGR
jgi:excisionase family DNA binding protein